jgi:hypothetical protein
VVTNSGIIGVITAVHDDKNQFEVEIAPWNSAVHFKEAFEFNLFSNFHFDIKYRAHPFISLNDPKVWLLALSKASFHF